MAKHLGRGVKNYDDATWADAREDIARRAVKHKFDQNPELWKVLEYTGNITLVEAAKWDRVWGGGITINELCQGKTHEGANLLGRIIAEYRDNRVAAEAAAAVANADLGSGTADRWCSGESQACGAFCASDRRRARRGAA